MNCAIEPQHTSFWFRGATVVHLSRLTNCPGGFWNWTGGVNGARVAPPLSDYEKAQEMSIIVIPTSTTRRISSSDCAPPAMVALRASREPCLPHQQKESLSCRSFVPGFKSLILATKVSYRNFIALPKKKMPSDKNLPASAQSEAVARSSIIFDISCTKGGNVFGRNARNVKRKSPSSSIPFEHYRMLRLTPRD
jgi:hypothetical protein